MQAEASVNGEPYNGSKSGYKSNAENKFADRSALGNSCDKDADERSPRNEPCPVEDSPVKSPAVVTVSVSKENSNPYVIKQCNQ